MNPESEPDPGYTNIRLKTHNSENPDFVYRWDQTRAEVVDFDLTIITNYPDNQYALVEAFEGPEHTEDEGSYFDAGFILVVEGGSLYIECVKFQGFNRLVLPALSIHSYPELTTSMSHGGVLSTHGGSMSIIACHFDNNTAKQGGAVYVTGTNTSEALVLIASGTKFTGNRAQYSGGAVFIEAAYPATVDIGTDRDLLFACSDYYDIYEPTTDGLTLIESDTDCGVYFAGNEAGYYGGAVSIASETPPSYDIGNVVNIHEYCEFVANVAGIDGGGMYMYYTPAVDIKGIVTFSGNNAEYGGALYGSRMLTFELGGSCVFESNTADECGGAMYLNVGGCSNPCIIGESDSSIRFSGNSAGTTQGDCPTSMIVVDSTFSANNCSYVRGFNCTPTSADADVSIFPQDEQALGLYTVDVQVNFNRDTIEETLSYFDFACNSTETVYEDSSCLTDCDKYSNDLACVDEDDQCLSLPCQNGATCYDGKNSFTCECVPGFEGFTCATNTPDCANQPCQNGATCVDGIQNYSCICTALYEGTHCDELRPDVLMDMATVDRLQWFLCLICIFVNFFFGV
jgi:predicted outer membrane repeat protein